MPKNNRSLVPHLRTSLHLSLMELREKVWGKTTWGVDSRNVGSKTTQVLVPFVHSSRPFEQTFRGVSGTTHRPEVTGSGSRLSLRVLSPVEKVRGVKSLTLRFRVSLLTECHRVGRTLSGSVLLLVLKGLNIVFPILRILVLTKTRVNFRN